MVSIRGRGNLYLVKKCSDRNPAATRPRLSIAVNVPPTPHIVARKRINMSTLKSAWSIVDGAETVFNSGEIEFLLKDDNDHEKPGEAERDVEKSIEHFELTRDPHGLNNPYRPEKHEGDNSRQPPDQENERFRIVTVNGVEELSQYCAAEADEAFEESEDDAAALGEVLDARDQRAGVGERLRVPGDADVEAHLPDFWGRDFFGDGEPHHEVAEEVEGGADEEDDPGRRDLVD
nr:hypothetical protein PanWU01x14_286830 [Ipomoea batatas]